MATFVSSLPPSLPSFRTQGRLWREEDMGREPGALLPHWGSSTLSKSQDTPQGCPQAQDAVAGRWLRWGSGGREGDGRGWIWSGRRRGQVRHRGVETRQRKTSYWLSRKAVHTVFLSAHIPSGSSCWLLSISPEAFTWNYGNTHMDQMALHPHPSFPTNPLALICHHPMRPPTFLSKEDLGAPPRLSVGEVQVFGGSILYRVDRPCTR